MIHPTTIALAGRPVGRVGYGTMRLTGPNALGEPDRPADLVALLRTAVDSGVGLIDTAGYYGPSVANRLVARALWPYPEELVIATKIGAARTPDGAFRPDTSPESLRTQVEQNLRDLRLDCLSLVHFRYLPDGPTPFPEAIGTMIEFHRQGLIKEIGISHVTLEQLDQAVRLTPIASIENQARFGAAEPDPVLARAAEALIPYLAYRPLENGTLLRTDGPLRRLAGEAGLAPATLALAWLLDRSPNLAVIPGTTSAGHLAENLAAIDVVLDDRLRRALTEGE
ncbi:aldo/keto reductase [Microlunatus sp. GCM10028923]|uniref:aldo/keto reductase n=1 Tax=Microlunatus sp. GCM10028923 TaxID=3273400 RepID=UPI0036183BDF